MSAGIEGASRGPKRYALLVAALMREPMTIRELGAETSASRRQRANVRRAITEMHAAKVVHVIGWKHLYRGNSGPPSSVWAIGSAPDATPTELRAKIPKPPKRTRPEMLAFLAALQLLQEGPCTARDIAEISGMTMTIAQQLIRHMHQHGVVHVAGWEYAGRTRVRLYLFGRGVDAKRPPRQSKRELGRRYEAKRAMLRDQKRMLYALTVQPYIATQRGLT